MEVKERIIACLRKNKLWEEFLDALSLEVNNEFEKNLRVGNYPKTFLVTTNTKYLHPITNELFIGEIDASGGQEIEGGDAESNYTNLISGGDAWSDKYILNIEIPLDKLIEIEGGHFFYQGKRSTTILYKGGPVYIEPYYATSIKFNIKERPDSISFTNEELKIKDLYNSPGSLLSISNELYRINEKVEFNDGEANLKEFTLRDPQILSSDSMLLSTSVGDLPVRDNDYIRQTVSLYGEVLDVRFKVKSINGRLVFIEPIRTEIEDIENQTTEVFNGFISGYPSTFTYERTLEVPLIIKSINVSKNSQEGKDIIRRNISLRSIVEIIE